MTATSLKIVAIIPFTVHVMAGIASLMKWHELEAEVSSTWPTSSLECITAHDNGRPFWECTSIIEHYKGLDATKPVSRVFDKPRLKPVSSATETNYKSEILLVAIFFLFDLILYVHSTIFQLCGTGIPGLNQY